MAKKGVAGPERTKPILAESAGERKNATGIGTGGVSGYSLRRASMGFKLAAW